MELFIASLVVIIIIMMAILYKCRKIKSELSTYIQQALVWGMLISVVVIGITICQNQSLSLLLFAVYFIETDWLLFVIAKYCLAYTNYGHLIKIFNWVFVLIVFDMFFLFMNYSQQYAFYVVGVETMGTTIYKFEPAGLFMIHGVIVYGLALTSVITLIVKLATCPRIYKKKYATILALISAIVLINAVIMFMGNTVDYSVYGYVIGAIMFYYFNFRFIPKELMNQTVSVVARESREGILIFDESGCVYSNTRAREYLRVDEGSEDLTNMTKDIFARKYIGRGYVLGDEEEEINQRKSIDGRTFYYRVFYRILRDSKGRKIGNSIIIYDTTEETMELQSQKYVATHDLLTDTYNKEYLFERISDRLEKEPDRDFVLICSDITKFRLINDLFGERIADGVLLKQVEEMQKRVPSGTLYGRLNADRFAMFMDAKLYDEKMLSEISDAINYVDRDYAYSVKLCFGVYYITDRKLPISIMCDRALGSLISIKENYRMCVAYYSEETLESIKREQEMIAELDDALDRRDITIFYQPIVKRDGTVVGAEALARWLHPSRGIIPPGEFIPVFEKSNLIVKMDLHIWELACERLAIWKREGKDWFISVNISTKDLYFLDIFDVFTKLVARYKIPAEKIRLEITESAVAKDVANITALIKKLQRFGFIVELDDFGSGYSSLNILKDLTVDVLKVDMKFLEASEGRSKIRSREILRSIISLAKRLGMQVITEGVEDAVQKQMLLEADCDMFQGYYFSKPVSEREFEEVAKNSEIG